MIEKINQVAKKKGSIMPIMAAGIVATFSFILVYKKGIVPFLQKRKARRNEEFAEFIFQQEKKSAENDNKFS
jgi:hypothetical protein